jgi:hypothetical protein
MNWLRSIRTRFRALFRKRELDSDMDEEMRSHSELRTQASIEAGMNSEEARFAALRQFGGTESIKETCREQRGVTWLENLAQDIRYGARQPLKNPGFTAVGVLTLAPVISRSIRPGKALLLVGVQPPDTQTGRHDSDHPAHSLGARAEGWVTKESANKVRRFILSNSQNHQAVPDMNERTSGQSQVAGEERWMGKCQQKRKDVLIGHALATDVQADLPNGDAPTAQQLALALQNVFIQDVHSPRGYTASSWAWCRNVSRAARTASAMASSLMLPRHSSTMLFQAIPAATCSSTSATRIRVPRNVGCPWQIFGSATT